jgi:hypothetical protein
MFKRSSRHEDASAGATDDGPSASAPDTGEVPGVTAGKGRPTRSRKEAEAARRRPLVVEDRKEAKRRDRARAAEERNRSQQALIDGNEAEMPAQHRGPERRLVRDLVDTRRNAAEYFFPVALALMLVALVLPIFLPQLYATMSLVLMVVLWGGIIICIIDSLRLRSRIRAAITEKYGDVRRGLVSYGVMRSLQIRRWRLPRAQISHGDSPR